ncbi:hypothetical protein Tco_1532724 [Tanacetum coccineum]
MLVQVRQFDFPMDFVILKMEEDSKVPLSLGSPFLHIADAIICVISKELNLIFGNERITFKINKAIKLNALLNDSDPFMGTSKKINENDLDREFVEFIEVKFEESPKEEADEDFEELTLEEQLRIKKSIQDPPTDLKMKHLPAHLEYAYLEKDSLLPAIIAFHLKADEKERLENVVADHLSRLENSNLEYAYKTGAENVAADHLSRLENPNLDELKEDEVDDNFLDKIIMKIKNDDEEIPWFADFANYLLGNILRKDLVGFLDEMKCLKTKSKSVKYLAKEFKAGDKVLLFNSKYKFKAPKLITKWYGPFMVKHGYPSSYVELYDKQGGSFIVNGHLVKLYHDEEQLNELSSKENHFMCKKGIVKGNILYIKENASSAASLSSSASTEPPLFATMMKKQSRRKQRKDIEVSQSSASIEPMTEKETNKEFVPTQSYDTSKSGEDRMQLYELMNLCTKLSDRVLALETTKITQVLEIASLKSRVKKLEKKASKRTHKFKRLYRGRSTEYIDKDAEVSLVDETQGMSDDTEMFNTDALIGDEVFAKNDMTKKEHDVIPKEVSAVETLTTASIKIPVSTAAPSTTVVSQPVITEVEITLAQTLAELKSEKSKVVIQELVQSTVTTVPSTILKAKGITFRDAGETITRTPTYDQIRLDEDLARRLDAEKQEAARLERENVKLQEQATLAKIKEWDNVQAMMDADYELCKRLQEQGELTIEEKSKLFMELMNKRKRRFAKLRAKEKKRKPLTKGQRRNQMCTYLKNIGGFTHIQLKNKSYEEIQKAFDKTIGWINNFKPMDSEEVKSSKKKDEGSRKKSIGKKRARNKQKQESSKRQRIKDDKETNEHEEAEEDDEAEMKKHIEIVQDKEEIAIDAIPLATKPPMIVEYKIVKEGQKGFYHLIRVDGSSKRYSSMIKMLQNIDREDLETLWKLVKAKHGNTRPGDDYERVFWGDLKVMFEPDIKSEVWRSLQGSKVTVWKLFDSCGVHFVRFKDLHIFMLVEKRYPLIPITITNMLNKKLQADYWNKMCYQLLKLMTKQKKGQ